MASLKDLPPYLRFWNLIIIVAAICFYRIVIVPFSSLTRTKQERGKTAYIIIPAVAVVIKLAHDNIKTLSVEVMEALARTIDAKDKYTNGHSSGVAKYSRMMAERMGTQFDPEVAKCMLKIIDEDKDYVFHE